MPPVSIFEAQELIMETFNEYSKSLRVNQDNPSTPFFYVRKDLSELEKILGKPGFPNELFDGLEEESYNYLLQQCNELADLYNLSTKRRLRGSRILKKVGLQNEPLEKLMSQVRKLGDAQLIRRLSDIETGNGFIVFEDMDKFTEGYTKFENGQLKYCLNRKYEKASTKEDLWRATIILAHELQRNPKTGDLRGETAEIVQKDVKFIEQLANKHGKRVYDLNPDFLVMHYVREMFGDEGVKAFADLVFNREGPYWRATGSFREYLNLWDQQFGGRPSWDFPAAIMGSVRALESIRNVITEALRSIKEEVSRRLFIEMQNAIDNALVASQNEIMRIYGESSARGSYKLFGVRDKGRRGINATLELVVESTRDGEFKQMLIAGVSGFLQKPTKIGIIELSIGLRQTFDLSLNNIHGSLTTNFFQEGGGSILGFIRDTVTTMSIAIDAKLSWIVADIGILIRRDVLDFSNGNVELVYDRFFDGLIAGVQITFGNRKFEWRVNVSDWVQGRR